MGAREMTDRDMALVALDAGVEIRTVRRALSGVPNRSRATRIAIVAALRKHRFYDQAKTLEAERRDARESIERNRRDLERLSVVVRRR